MLIRVTIVFAILSDPHRPKAPNPSRSNGPHRAPPTGSRISRESGPTPPYALRASRESCGKSFPDGKGSSGVRETIGSNQDRPSARSGQRGHLQSSLVRLGHQGCRHAADFAGGGTS